jgi:hypothetical protein
LLSRKRRLQQRVHVAKRVHAMRALEVGAEDVSLWDRLSDELPEWAYSGVVGPVTVDRLHQCLGELDPRTQVEPGRRKRARASVRSILDDLYRVLIISDPITRWSRDLGHVLRVRRQTRGGMGFAPWEWVVLGLLWLVVLVGVASLLL